MKLIEKLFNRMGYVPKRAYEDIDGQLRAVTQHNIAVYRAEVVYIFAECVDCFAVFSQNGMDRRVIKCFPKGATKDSKELARICAEELVEMLNQKY